MKKVLVSLALWLFAVTAHADVAVKENFMMCSTTPFILQQDSVLKKSNTKNNDTLTATYKEIFDDPAIKSYFSMSLGSSVRSGEVSNKVSDENSMQLLEIGIKPGVLFSTLLRCNENQIELPKELKNKVISYCFKQDKLLNRAHGEKILLNKVLENLQLKMVQTDALQDVIVITLTDSLKLSQAKVPAKEDLNTTQIQTNGTTALSVQNGTVNTLVTQLQSIVTIKVEMEKVNQLNGHYHFIINNDSFEALQQSLLKYGLTATKVQRNLQKYIFTK
ncbi:hypothetical protein [Pedobacter sp.]|uniref:hypothetical protein n=1 Tax=Pedobacter sp. TaxID=1411316 RepID=UPI003D7FC581